MADVTKIKLPDNSTVNIKDYRIPGVDTVPTSGSNNLITSGGVYQELEDGDWVTTEEYTQIEGVLKDTYTKEEVDEIIDALPASNITTYDIQNWNDKVSNIQADWTATTGDAVILHKPTLATVATSGSYNDLTNKPTIPTESTVEGWGFVKQTSGGVSSVKVGSTTYNPSNGVVSLPAYPTTLPASDVSAWAKASTKPTYTANEVGAATESYVDTAVAGIVNSAPTTLDTLNELATALGNDPNFATTVATQIGEKVSKTSSTDNAIVRFDGTNGEIQNSGVTVDDNNNVVTAGALYLTNIGSSVSNSTSRLYFGSQSSPYNYITANTSGVFGIYRASDGKGIACYPNENFFSNSNIDLGRTQSLWKNLYLSGTIGNGTYSLTLPNKSGTIATTDDIPSAITESTVSEWGFTKNTGTYSKPSGGIPATDLTSAVQTSLGKADTALQSYTETDPTVPSWAKAANKPTYTASEVGALPDTTVIPSAPGTLKTNNTTAQSTSASESFSGTINLHQVAKTGSYNDLLNKPTIPAAVTESTVSGWGFTKNVAPGTLKTNATTAQTASSGEAMSGTITLHKVAKTGTYSDLIGTPTIPTESTVSGWGFTKNAGTLTGVTFNGTSATVSNGVAAITATIPNITVSSSEPTSSQGSNGDIWIVV